MIEIDHLTKRLGDTLIVDDVSMVVEAGTIAVVVGNIRSRQVDPAADDQSVDRPDVGSGSHRWN